MAMMEERQVKFQIGDEVRDGAGVGIVTDVGTILIQVRTSAGRLRVVCVWELVKTRVG
jgi:Mechanosensitive ion channel